MAENELTHGARERLRRARGFMFDLDGTLALGDDKGHGLVPLPGAREMLSAMQRGGVPYVVFTNGTLRTPRETAEKLRAVGLDVPDDRAMTPSSVAAVHFAERKLSPVLVLGCEASWKPLVENGVEVLLPGNYRGGAKAVYVAWYREFTMGDLEIAYEAVTAGAKLYTASNVPFFSTARGRAMGTSFAICAMLKAYTGKSARVLGKPSAIALKVISRRLGMPDSDIAIIGDDPLCEIRLARYGKALAVGVTTGHTRRDAFEKQKGNYRADLLVDSLPELSPPLPG